ncbi:DUF1284 domain-containing protein [uncultured Clostridium sp.]|uniref:DUF1284 domain-containing protein n=1 Tax=uncultured Clostridium sp. TaxID=59620 RepID=UPI0026342C70|nr:DUF1284 domain-containing protein [uncultured Clostridium sp.]
MIELRPHHILCIQNYKGKGYSDEFTYNMEKVIEKLKVEDKVKIIFKEDDICHKCPNKKEKDECITTDKVKEIDKKVIKYFHIEEKIYVYSKLNKEIRININEEMKKDICGCCEWYIKKVCFNEKIN